MAKKILQKVESTLPDEELNVPVVGAEAEVIPVVGEASAEAPIAENVIASGHEITYAEPSEPVTITPVIEPVAVTPAVEVKYEIKADTYTLDRKMMNKLFFCLQSPGLAKQYIGSSAISRVGELFGCKTSEECLVQYKRIVDEFNEANK
jgi:hypothetical protein